MINNMFLSVPAELEEIWWMYDLILLVLIAVCAVLLVITKRKSDKALAEKNLGNAVRVLKKSDKYKKSTLRIRLFTAKNLLQTASYYYGKVLEEKDEFSLTKKLEAIKEINAECDALIKSLDKASASERSDRLASITSKISFVKES